MKNFLAVVLSISIFVSCKQEKQQIDVPPTSKALTYMGRTVYTSDSLVSELCWSGASVALNFEGTCVKAKLKNYERDNYYNVIIDGLLDTILRIDTLQTEYTLGKNLSEGAHRVELFRRTEWTFGKTQFYGFKIEGNAKLLPADQKKKKSIEFYGNSITVGYGVDDDTEQDRWDSIFSNNYHSYARLTAKYFDADYSCIARSGIGITVSWFDQIMPELYYRHDPTNEKSIWNFSAHQKDVVVVNLFQNDSWIVNMPKNEQYQKRFAKQAPTKQFIIKSYADFIGKLRSHYPKAKIICMLGSMDATKEGSVWPGYVKEAVKSLNDASIYTFFMPYKKSSGHPEVEDQKLMSKALCTFIKENIEW